MFNEAHGSLLTRSIRCGLALLMCGAMVGDTLAQPPAFDAALRDQIDAFIEAQRQASGVSGIALAIVNERGPVHVRGFGHDGHGTPVSADTPFLIGSLTKSFTALLARQAIAAGQLDAGAPVQRYLARHRRPGTVAAPAEPSTLYQASR